MILGLRVFEESIFEKAFAGTDTLSMQRHTKHTKTFDCNSWRTKRFKKSVKFKTISKIFFGILTSVSQELNRADSRQEIGFTKEFTEQ